MILRPCKTKHTQEDIKTVVGAIIRSKYSCRTESGIVESTGYDKAKVEDILNLLLSAGLAESRIGISGKTLWKITSKVRLSAYNSGHERSLLVLSGFSSIFTNKFYLSGKYSLRWLHNFTCPRNVNCIVLPKTCTNKISIDVLKKLTIASLFILLLPFFQTCSDKNITENSWLKDSPLAQPVTSIYSDDPQIIV